MLEVSNWLFAWVLTSCPDREVNCRRSGVEVVDATSCEQDLDCCRWALRKSSFAAFAASRPDGGSQPLSRNRERLPHVRLSRRKAIEFRPSPRCASRSRIYPFDKEEFSDLYPAVVRPGIDSS